MTVRYQDILHRSVPFNKEASHSRFHRN